MTTTVSAQLTLDDALARKLAGLARVEATHPDFVPRLRAAAKAFALQHDECAALRASRLRLAKALVCQPPIDASETQAINVIVDEARRIVREEG